MPAHPLLILPTFNEADNINDLLDEVMRIEPELHVLVVDDASPDGTADLVRDRIRNNDHIHLNVRSSKLGIGSALRHGMDWGLRKKYHPIATMDADGSHPPTLLPQLLDAVHRGADIAIGSRYISGGGLEDWPWFRRWLSKTANRVARLLLWMPIHDVTSGLRAYSASALKRIHPEAVKADGYSFLEEVLWRAHKLNFQFQEIPFVFKDRQLGSSKISKKEIYLAMGTLIRLSLSRRPRDTSA